MYDTPRYTLRQRLLQAFSYGLVSTTTSSTNSTSINDTARAEVASAWFGSEALIRNGSDANVGISRRVTASATSLLTTAAFPATVASGVEYELAEWYSFNQLNDAIRDAVERSWGLHWISMLWNGLTIVAGTYDYALPSLIEGQTITIDAGSTTSTLRDAALTQADDYWNGARVVALSGTAGNLGLVRTVTDFAAATDDLTLDHILPATPAAADTYHLIRPAMDYVFYVEYIPSGATLPIPISDRDWSIVNMGGPYIRFNPSSIPPTSSVVRIFGLRKPIIPTADYHPIEVPDDYAINQANWQLLRSRPRKDTYQLDNVEMLKRESWDKAQKDLLREGYRKPAGAKRVR